MLGALMARGRDGTGQHIDVALLDCATSAVVNYAQLGLLTGNSPKRYGGDHPFIEPLGLYECSDGLISLVCGNERQWEKLCKDGLERPDLLDDPKLTDAATRVANRQYCRDTLGAALKTNTRDYWVPKLRAAGLPVGAVRDVVEALNAPEFRARDMIATTTHARIGEIEQVGSPIKLSRTPVAEPVAPPLLGQHSRDALAFAGFSADEIEALISSGVVTEDTN